MKRIVYALTLVSAVYLPQDASAQIKKGDVLLVSKNHTPVQKKTEVLGRLDKGTKVVAQDVLETDTGVWVRVDHLTVPSVGWMHADYLARPEADQSQSETPKKLTSQAAATLLYWNTAAQHVDTICKIEKKKKASDEILSKASKALLNLKSDDVDVEAVETVTKIAIGFREEAAQLKSFIARSIGSSLQAQSGYQGGYQGGSQGGRIDVAGPIAQGAIQGVKFGLAEVETMRKRFQALENATILTRAKLQVQHRVSLDEISFHAYTGLE